VFVGSTPSKTAVKRFITFCIHSRRVEA
jgi:hypothetical protein